MKNSTATIDSAELLSIEQGVASSEVGRKPSELAGGIKDIVSGKPSGLAPILKTKRILKGHLGKVYALHWSSSSTELVSASQDGKLIVWDAMNNVALHTIPLRSSWVLTCAFEPSRRNLVACGGLDNLCSIYQIQEASSNQRIHRELAAHEGYLSCCRFIDENFILTSSGDHSCMLWDIEAGVSKQTFAEHESDVMCIAVQPDVNPNLFVSGSCDRSIKLWDIRSGACTATLRGHEDDVNAVCLLADMQSLGSGSDDSTSSSNRGSPPPAVTSVCFSRSGRVLFAGYEDAQCLGWDVLTVNSSPTANPSSGSTSTGLSCKPVYRLTGHEGRVSCLAVAPNGDALCTGSWDSTLRIWA
eukprot:gene27872-36721_t